VTWPAEPQVCRLSVAGLNRARRVTGPVSTECPGPLVVHSAPFGNWGAASNFGPKLNGHQFQGWCHDTRTCDNEGNCGASCTDGWYEWNSCTDHPRYRAPNCTLYNADECTSQISTTGVNVLGTRTVDIPVRCPFDSDQDGLPDQGGCRDVPVYSHGTNFMSLYELDPAGPDQLVQTLYFPPTPVTTNCSLLGCTATISDWAPPSFYDSPSSPAKVYAEMATIVNSGAFLDAGNVCQASWPAISTVSAASLTGGAVAPESIVSSFGIGLAPATAAAEQTPLPTTLAGTSVRIRDSRGVERLAPLFFVSPGQVNYLLPAETAPGTATVVVHSGAGILATGSTLVEAVAPGVFSANASGAGVAAAVAVRVKADGSQTPVAVFRCGAEPGSCVPEPIDLGPPAERVYLSLYGTGIRAGWFQSVTIGGVESEITYAGPQGYFVGLDQVNVLLPRSLAGRGTVSVALKVIGKPANPVTIALR
jgi:uncharacterized protein (TIGR03437 family)